MKTSHETVIHAPPVTVFRIGAAVERWPDLDPAYLWCRILERGAGRTVFEMAGNIRGWPGRWTAVQELFPDENRILFTHLRGITTGMRVEWQLRPAPAGAGLRDAPAATRLQITHDLHLPWPFIGTLVSDRIIGPIFIDWIARRTLSAVQRVAESRTNLAGSSSDPAAPASQVRTGDDGATA